MTNKHHKPETIAKMKSARARQIITEETKKKISQTLTGRKFPNKIGAGNSQWKGTKVGYKGLHDWVSRNFGKPKKCEHCGTTKAKKFEWANVSGKYLRKFSDWLRLCTSCHHKFDDIGNKSWKTKLKNNL